jgi:protein-disulfide isomerase
MMTSHGSQLTVPVTERDHSQGPSTAPVTLVEYGDYERPYCGAAYPIVKEIRRRLGDRLRLVFRDFPPTTAPPHAEHAAEAAEAAGAQGKFWEMHDLLFEHQRALDDAHLEAYAAVGLDIERFDREMKGQVHAGRVRADFIGGVRSGVNGTPTFFINGRRHDDSYDLETLLASIDAAVPEAAGGTG